MENDRISLIELSSFTQEPEKPSSNQVTDPDRGSQNQQDNAHTAEHPKPYTRINPKPRTLNPIIPRP